MESQTKRAVCFSKSLPKDSTAPFANQSTPGATSQRSKLPKLTSAVPDLMLKGLVEDEKAALPPLPLLASGR